MARKRGDKNVDSKIKEQQALAAKLEGNKTHEEVALEEGVHHSTITRRIQKALSQEEIRGYIDQSRDRVIQMLSRCDDAYLRVLTYNHPDNFGNQVKVAQSIYRTVGVLQDEPSIQINNIVPIKVTVDGKEYEFAPQTHEQGKY